MKSLINEITSVAITQKDVATKTATIESLAKNCESEIQALKTTTKAVESKVDEGSKTKISSDYIQ